MLGWFQTWSQLSKECLGPGRLRRAVEAEAERAGSGCGRGGVGSQLEEPKVIPRSESNWTWELPLSLQLKPVPGVVGQ